MVIYMDRSRSTSAFPRPYLCGPSGICHLELCTDSNFFLGSKKVLESHNFVPHTFKLVNTMATVDVASHKRKRKHKSKKSDETDVPEARNNGASAIEKSRKKSKKEHTPEPEAEAEDAVADAVVDGAKSEDEEDEEAVNEELKQIAVREKVAKMGEDEDSEQEFGSGANGEALGATDLPSGTSMPMMENPTLFSELKLSERTMEAIEAMGFKTMTEIQQKTIPPLLRYISRELEKSYSNIL